MITTFAELATYSYATNHNHRGFSNAGANRAIVQGRGIEVTDVKGFDMGPDGNGWANPFGFTAILKWPTGRSGAKRVIGVVAFRGSARKSDWRDNFNAGWRSDIYKGFYVRAQKYGPMIKRQLEAMKRANPSMDDVVFTGHSLGGADASICPSYITRLGKRSSNLARVKYHAITFGQPRPGTQDFQSESRRSLTFYRRIANAGDPVTSVPPSTAGFAHIDDGLLLYADPSTLTIKKYDITKWGGGLSAYERTVGLSGSIIGSTNKGTHGHDMEGVYLSRLREIFYER